MMPGGQGMMGMGMRPGMPAGNPMMAMMMMNMMNMQLASSQCPANIQVVTEI